LANEERCCSRFDRGKEDGFELSPCGGPFLLLASLQVDADIVAIVVAIVLNCLDPRFYPVGSNLLATTSTTSTNLRK
jgi:hypothetical protein